jgi:probable rRNA maturation factor
MRVRLDVVNGDAADYEPLVDRETLGLELGGLAESMVSKSCSELSAVVSFVSAKRIRGLNAMYRGIDEETDVLSFPLWEAEGIFSPPEWDDLPLGDVVVSPEYVFKTANGGDLDYNSEIILVIIHGVLHLLGFDHDTEEKERVMWREQESLLKGYFAKAQGQ